MTNRHPLAGVAGPGGQIDIGRVAAQRGFGLDLERLLNAAPEQVKEYLRKAHERPDLMGFADTKISGLTELAETPAASDVIPVVDVSDTTQAASGTTKKVQRGNMGFPNGPIPPVAMGPLASTAVGANNTYFAAVLWLPAGSYTGIRYRIGATNSGNKRAALYEPGGTRLGNITSDVTTGTANQLQDLAFTGGSITLSTAGVYLPLVHFLGAASSTHTFFGGRWAGGTLTGTRTTDTPPSGTFTVFSLSAENADRPALFVY